MTPTRSSHAYEANVPIHREVSLDPDHSADHGPQSEESLEDPESVRAETALTRFYHNSIHASTWTVFDENANVRIAYIGAPISNLTALVGEEASITGYPHHVLHYPFPSTKTPMPWRPSKTLPLLKWYSSGLADDISALPSKELRDNMVDAFFRDVHPGFPVVEEALFRAQYKDPRNPPPLLLYQAVLLVGAHVSMHPTIVRSRSLIKMALFRRAKALFDLHYENNRMHLVQAALLFTWHHESSDDVSSNAYFWVGVACRIAFGLGMHRNLSPSAISKMPLNDRRIYRRIFWTLFQVDALTALHHGRPLNINQDDCDQPPLVADDFFDDDKPPTNNAGVEYCINSVALCTIIVSLIRSTSPAAFRRYNADPSQFSAMLLGLDAQLAGWYMNLQTPLQTSGTSESHFWSLQLQLHYNLTLLNLHRLSSAVQIHMDNAQNKASTETCHNAAGTIIRLFEDILNKGQTRQCWSTASPTLLAAAIQTSHEARVAAKSNMAVLATQGQAQLERLLPVIRAVTGYWGGADAVLHLYSSMSNDLKQQVQSLLLTQGRSQTDGNISTDSEYARSFNASNPSRPSAELNTAYPGYFDNGWRSLFGAGEPGELLDVNLSGLDGWLTSPSNVIYANAPGLESSFMGNADEAFREPNR